MSDNDYLEWEKNLDPHGITEAQKRVEAEEPRQLEYLYERVVSGLESEPENVPLDAILLLLKRMGPPTYTSQKLEDVEDLNRIYAQQISGLFTEKQRLHGFEESCKKIYEIMKMKNLESFESFLQRMEDRKYKQKRKIL